MKLFFSLGHVSEPFLRWFGIGLIASGLGLPFVDLVGRAASWKPPVVVAEDAPVLRPELVIIPAGKFLMGSPEDELRRDADEELHDVEIAQPFAIARTEISQAQYLEVMSKRPEESEHCNGAGVAANLPIVCVSWFDAVEYCNRLSEREGLQVAYEIQGEDVRWDRESLGYRLPTEEEWEYAARAGTQTRWVGTDDVDAVCDYANVGDLSAKAKNPWAEWFKCDDSFPTLAPVDALEPNRWELFGMGGNAAEWTWDSYYGTYPDSDEGNPNRNVAGASPSAYRVVRGGAWWQAPRHARVANRRREVASSRNAFLGFRVARSLPSDF
ncbi:MAG: formylglycine-generating enzyme family protein [Thermoanaerobaculia bacterium]|nr:formylglycine-generating enzyme family protein [Thermoanaerobaculia bacterium]